MSDFDYITIKFEANKPQLLNHIGTMVFISTKGKRKAYYTEYGLFTDGEEELALTVARRLSKPGVKFSIVRYDIH